MSDCVVFIDDLERSSSKAICKICHQDEIESGNQLEAPCGCNGSLKFAHRDCIQRWCNEKGNTICEICLKRYEPGYTAPPKREDEIITIRERLQARRREEEERNEDEIMRARYSSQSAVARATSWCNSFGTILILLFLFVNILDVLIQGIWDAPLHRQTFAAAKATGTLFPVFILIKMLSAAWCRHRHQDYERYYEEEE